MMSVPLQTLAATVASRSALLPLRPKALVQGKLVRMVGLTLEAVGIYVALGSRCRICFKNRNILAEVVGFSDDRTYLMPIENVTGICSGATVIPVDDKDEIPVGKELLGRVIDGMGRAIDGKGDILSSDSISFESKPINPLQRQPISQGLDVGIRAINACLTVGKGQRLGLFAGSGVGKSVLLGMMTRFTQADIVVVALIGERGREVKEFIEQSLGTAGLAKAIVIASPADEAPLMRMRAATLATRIAEYFRDQGKDVLLLMDSLTRFAQAQREIALSIGEPPATKGYPPSVFARLPSLVERAGTSANGNGSITAFYTVLTEGDDLQDPVADSARAILDGHIVLSRSLADEGHYPAIDIEKSISRAMTSIVNAEHLEGAQRIKQLYSRYQQNRDLISVGAYAVGSDQFIDEAIAARPVISLFLQQRLDESVGFAESIQHMAGVVAAQKGSGDTQSEMDLQ